MSSHLDVVFLDVGGPIYDDGWYYRSLLRALREIDPHVSEQAFADEYEACRRAQDGSFRRRLTRTLLGPDAPVDEVAARAERYWEYPPEALLPDVPACLEELSERYRLGILANQQAWVREVMRRDGIDRRFSIWVVSEEVGLEKPDIGIFRLALERSGAPAERTAMVGDRLDNDVRPAREVGMRTVWVLRGEAPDDPTPEQLAVPDATVRSLAELPETLEGLDRARPGG